MKFRKKNNDLRLFFGVSIVISLILIPINQDLAISLLTELISVAITIFVINKILERRERQKRIAIDQRILRDIQAIIASYFSIWKHIVWQFAPDEKIGSEKHFISLYPQLVRNSTINDRFKFVSIHHPESWELFFNNRTIKDCFRNYHTTVINQIQTFINDFKIYIEPELLDILLNILDDQYFKDIYLMGQDDTVNIVIEYGDDPNKLDSYLRAEDLKHLNHLMELIAYGNRLRDLIDKYTDVNVELYQIKKYFVNPSLQFTTHTGSLN